MSSQTYEQNAANTSLAQSPDPIHWNPNYSYRNSPYRHLHHQEKNCNGTIGNFTVRLVEANGLVRSHWSLLGMGPVKHLGLSNAHGEVSSYATMKLGFRFRDSSLDSGGESAPNVYRTASAGYDGHQQGYGGGGWQHGTIASVAAAAAASTSSSSPNKNIMNTNTINILYTSNNKTYQSSTIPFNSSPKWPSVQTESNKSLFTVPLKKGAMPQDGMKIVLTVEMREEKTAVDSIVPIGKGGSGDGSLLGAGEIDLTRLVLRGLVMDVDRRGVERSSDIGSGSGSGSAAGKGGNDQSNDFVDLFDDWIHLSNPNLPHSSDASRDSKKIHNDSNRNDENHNARCGKVRLIISYEPCGMKPQKGDIIAFESFARRPVVFCKCPTIVPPLHPLQIKDMKGEYILASYDMINTHYSPTMAQEEQQQQFYNDNMAFIENRNDHHNFNDIGGREDGREKRKRGTVRIHRNTIFVIERTNLLDTAVDLSLKPTDMVMSTAIGRNVSHAAQPYVEAAGDLLAPVLLSSRLLLEASKVGGGALAVGLKTAVVSVVESSDPEKRRKAKRSSFYDD